MNLEAGLITRALTEISARFAALGQLSGRSFHSRLKWPDLADFLILAAINDCGWAK